VRFVPRSAVSEATSGERATAIAAGGSVWQGGSMVQYKHRASQRAWPGFARSIAALIASTGLAAPHVWAQGVTSPVTRVSMNDAVRLALERNQTLRGQRLTIDQSRADETTAALKPNPGFSFGAEGFPLISPRQINGDFLRSTVSYSTSLSYTFERGDKRLKRTTAAEDTTEVTRRNVIDLERQLRFQAEQAFVAALLAKSTLELAQQNLQSFSDVVELNRERVTAGDLAQGEFYKISLQKLQFEQDVSAAQVGLVQAKASLRQLMGFETIADDFAIDGDLSFAPYTLNLDDLKRQALENRPDVEAARLGVKLAQDAAALERGNRARDVTGDVGYSHTGPDNLFGVGFSIDLPVHDRNQGNIARSEIAVRQANEAEAATRFMAVTDVVNAYAAFETNQKVVNLYQSGYLDQARQSLEITTYVYQHGAGTLLDLLDAERTFRATELAYRDALAAYMTSLRQLNFAVGRQVIP
jgi:cobalt-zinc-cadmium efflux system outer membrane protein